MSPYTPLNPCESEIRLVELLPSEFDDPIVIRLSTARLSNNPIFEALSYVWGTELANEKATVNGYPLTITSNLDNALRSFRYPFESRTIWIDAICINQNDIDERNHQVQLMCEIYSTASDVIVWLGHATENSDFMLSRWNAASVAAEEIPHFICCVAEFCQRPWFSRTWVVQEVVLSRNDPRFFCGQSSFQWAQFCKFLDVLYQRFFELHIPSDDDYFPSVYKTTLDDFSAWESYLGYNDQLVMQEQRRTISGFFTARAGISRVRTMRLSGPLSRFSTQLGLTLHLEVTDKRDKVFGLLGMCAFESKKILPDYTKSMVEVYSEAMAYIITEDFASGYPSLILQVTGMDSRRGFPAWVPNFAAQRFSSPDKGEPVTPRDLVPKFPDMLNTLITRAMRIVPIATFSQDFETLYTYGMELGMIGASFSWKPHPGIMKDLENWSNWMSGIVSTVRGHRISLESILEVLCRPGIEIAQDEWDSAFPAFKRLFNSARRCKSLVDVPDKEMFHLLGDIQSVNRITSFFMDKTFFIMKTKRIGLSIGDVKEGDILAGLFGINFPCVLRSKAEKYTLVNIARVVGLDYGHDFFEDARSPLGREELEMVGLKEFIIV